MSTTPCTPDSVSTVEQAITAYLAERPYSSRFKARNLANETAIDASTREIASVLTDMEEDGTLEKLSYSSGASNYRPTDETQFRMELEADQ